jgi:hypothetical protein
MLGVTPFLNNNSFSNTAMAQGYDDYYSDSYSPYPTDDKKYECRTGPFEGFFVSSVEFCIHVKFDKDDRKDISRDNIIGTQGPIDPNGTQGEQGPSGITQLINGSNIYKVENSQSGNSTAADGIILQAFACCDPGDFVLNGGFSTGGITFGDVNIDDYPNLPDFLGGTWGWFTHIHIQGDAELTLFVDAFCFDNPPLRP